MIAHSLMAAMLAASAGSAEQAGSDVSGLWRAPGDGGSVVRLAPCDADLCGFIVTSPHIALDPNQKDVRNRDAAKRNRALRNLMFLRVRATGPGRWGDGWVYNPEDGGLYKGVMVLKADGALHLTGCIMQPFCKTETWRRAD
uniref:DUF2147 domain-containing protein n=1 Tax=Caulobacter sp. (strain K31) TaxID=366602 RepID=B0SXL6_CAUSK